VKVQVGEEAYVHVKIYKPLPHTGEPARVTNVETGKSKEDSL